MLSRRHFMAGAALPLLGAARVAATMPPGVPGSDRLRFAVMREGARIGEHALVFTPVADGVDIRIDVNITVRLGPIPLFHYALRGLEQWRGGQCVYAAANANDDGTKAFMVATRDARGLWVRGSRAGKYLAPPAALVASHWNKAELRGPWINLQDGRLFHPAVRDAGPGPVLLAGGARLPAERYVISGDVHLDLWYEGPLWTGLSFKASDGSRVRYEKMSG